MQTPLTLKYVISQVNTYYE